MDQIERSLEKTSTSLILAQFLVVLWCGWESKELLQLYKIDGLYDSFPGYFFFIWLVPFCIHWTKALLMRQPITTNISLSIIGILCALFGRMISFEFPGQSVLAMALGGLLPPSRQSLLWIIGACCWIHPFKWFVVRALSPHFVTPVRFMFLSMSLLVFTPLSKTYFNRK